MIIKMKIILVLVLDIILYFSLSVQEDGSGDKNHTICVIVGGMMKSIYTFDVSQLPKRCDSVLIGQYSFDRDDSMFDSDESTIKSFVEANITVYTYIGYDCIDSDWSKLFDPQNEENFNTTLLYPLIDFIDTYKINGIIIRCPLLYNIQLSNLDQKITEFVSKIKNKASNITIGLYLDGFDYEKFKDPKLFDFSITNEAFDLYFIDWPFINGCTQYTTKTGLLPVTSTDPNMITGSIITDAVINSDIDPDKIYALIQVAAVFPIDSTSSIPFTTYSEYCGSQDSSDWCISPSNVSYDQGVYVKKNYVGIAIESIDSDDFEGNCGCDKFPVTKQLLDGWTGSTFETCPKLD